MEHFFPNAAKTGGVFFEMGAIDGVKLSNTYLLGMHSLGVQNMVTVYTLALTVSLNTQTRWVGVGC